ncbi:hypothetical protein HA402_009125 [Bradysia odoriphaga]|nr:hypothetical protein HA402_009125 [Bradysia odoriphaga]
MEKANIDAKDLIEDVDENMPLELMEHAKAAKMETLPIKSKEKYNRVYQNFKEWTKSYGVTAITSDLIIAYFHMLDEKKYKPTSLWAFHSMLKSTLRAYDNVDIGKFCQVAAFLKTKSSGHKVVKAKVFAESDILKFIDETDDLAWLDVKVVLIFGICGACRTDELTRITRDDVERHGDLFLVKLQTTKTKVSGSFTINGKFAMIVQKYIDLRPNRVEGKDRFFMNYQRGKCTVQFIGKNKFAQMPRRIAAYLGLPEVDRYTGHTFRRTSATILANSGADLETIMRHGRWRTGSCAKGYIEDSLQYKAKTGQMIHCSILGSSSAPPARFDTIGVIPTIANTSVQLPNAMLTAPLVAVMSARTIATPASAVSSVDSFFDSLIADNDLVDITEHASQNHANEQASADTHDHFVPVKRRRPGGDSILQNFSQKNYSTSAVSSVDSFFDSSFADDDLVGITEHASQNHANEQASADTHNHFVPAKCHQPGGETVLQNCSQTNNSFLNAVLARSFKSANFERMENCTFNFYMSK